MKIQFRLHRNEWAALKSTLLEGYDCEEKHEGENFSASFYNKDGDFYLNIHGTFINEEKENGNAI
jgi:hypothetical protein